MKHLFKKQGIQGAGLFRRRRPPPPPPAKLDPPVLGIHSLAGSFAHSETLDLVSDGPIEGFVDKNGILCNQDIFKGIYLNDTVVKTNEGKYNFGNVLAQANFGEEGQGVLRNFEHVYIDTVYNSSLIGPYRQNGNIDRIAENKNIFTASWAMTRGGQPLNYSNSEGSNDQANRLTKNSYTNWNKLDNGDEIAIPIKHTISNPHVTACTVALNITALVDTMSQDLEGVTHAYGGKKKLKAGSKFPSVLYVEVETGKIKEDGSEEVYSQSVFRFVSLVEAEMNIELGNSDVSKYQEYYKWVATESNNLFKAFELPSASISGKEQSYEKRYIKVTRRSTETFSSLVTKKCRLSKISEIIPISLRYPFSAIVGTKIDSRSFASIPSRIYDLKLKRIKIPSNYNPIHSDGSDKRYLKRASDTKHKVYDGIWDGTFTIGWTDNPAWILYDLITSKRYGLGQYINEDKVDKWDLYKIGRFCDAVDENGVFVGVPDLRGGLEPRFSCNILIQEKTKLFDSINMIASLFRGIVYYSNSEINFVDDRPKTPSALFTNSNVKDGFFGYSNYKRDEQYNTIEVLYIDRFENFESKIEYIEDEEDIRKRGVFKKTISPAGVTSRAMARRIGEHFIFQTIKENQSVTFIAGLESLLCKPGDLIIIEDELKTLKSNFGRVLSVDQASRTIRLSEKYNSSDFDESLTVYTPTGLPTLEEQNNPNGDQTIIDYRTNELVSNTPQITTFNNITLVTNKEFGSEVIVSPSDPNVNLIQYISEGSTYRYKRKNLDDKIYKVLSIKEENPNEYQIIAVKYLTGKFNFIEKKQSIQYKEDPYNVITDDGTDSNIIYDTLAYPDNFIINLQKVSNQNRLYGNWDSVPNATGYYVSCSHPNGVFEEKEITSLSTYFVISSIGNYVFSLKALGNSSIPVNNTLYFNSETISENFFFINEDDSSLVQNDRSYMYNITVV